MRYWRTPLDVHEVKIPKGEIHLIIERCKGCEFCVEFCPRGVLEMSTDFNKKGYHYPVVLKPDLCVECDLCEVICPDFAIFCLPEEGGGETSHSDLENGSQKQSGPDNQGEEVKDATG